MLSAVAMIGAILILACLVFFGSGRRVQRFAQDTQPAVAAFNPSNLGVRSSWDKPAVAVSRSGNSDSGHCTLVMNSATLKSRKGKGTAQGTKRKLRKSHSQHFLVDADVIHELIDAVQKKDDGHRCDLILEVGPGEGAITRRLLQRDSRAVVAMELDPLCIRPLDALSKQAGNMSGSQPRLLLQHVNALEISWTGLGAQRMGADFGKIDMISNVPFGITSKLLYKALDEHRVIRRMALILQQEVVDKLTSVPTDGRSYSSLSVEFQLRGAVQVLNHRIPKTAFTPNPKVHTASVLLDWDVGKAHSEVQNWSDQQWLDLQRVLKPAFLCRASDLKVSLREVVAPEFLDGSKGGGDHWWHMLSGPELTPAQYAQLVNELTSADAFVRT